MNNLESCYQVLCIQPNASLEEVKQAYKDLIQVWHPDRYAYNPHLQQKAEAQTKEINSAYELITECFAQNHTQNFEKHNQKNNSNCKSPSQAQTVSTPAQQSPEQVSFVEQFVMDLFKLNPEQQKSLEHRIKEFTSIDSWKSYIFKAVATAGGIAGAIGGPVGYGLLLYDLRECKKNAATGCFGIGHIIASEVDYVIDGKMILALWVGEGEIATAVPAGKVGIKINNKTASASTASAVTGMIVSKVAAKLSTKLLAKLTSKIVAKAVAKISVKLAAKTSTAWIPLFGGVVSGGVNVWLVGGLLKASEQYYTAQKSNESVYLVLNDNDFVAEI